MLAGAGGLAPGGPQALKDGELPENDGTIVALDQGDPKKLTTQQYGPRNEKLQEMEPELVACLWSLIHSYYMEGIVARRNEIRRIKQARLFWQGLQYLTGYDYGSMDWNVVGASSKTGLSVDEDENASGRYQFVTNLYQAFGLAFIALMSQEAPGVTWLPQSAQSDEDVTTAKAATNIAELVQENNDPEELLKAISYFLWCDGVVVGHVREVIDGQEFGFHDSPIMELAEQKLGPDYFQCPSCGEQTPGAGTQYENCAQCGTGMGPGDFQQAPTAKVPTVTQIKKVPNGQEVISIYGGLESNRPIYENDPVKDGAYLGLQFEVHEAKLRAMYPHVADKILAGSPADAEDIYARATRLSVKQGLPVTHPGDALHSLTTTSLYWIEPWAFSSELVKKDMRPKLIELFPNGCMVVFAGMQYCESRNESKRDHIRILQPLPGDGQNRPAVGSSLVSVQERYNILSNIAQETAEYGIPPIYADPQVLDFDALADQVAEPAAMYPARPRAGQPLANGFFQPAPTQVSPDVVKSMDDLFGAIAQFLTGMLPSMFGGEMNGNDTAQGYSMARDQALGRLGLYWRGVKWFWADIMQLGVECFRANRSGDVERVVLGEDGGYESKIISQADLKGKVHARPESDEAFPKLKSQQRAALMAMMGVDHPVVGQTLSDPANIGTIKNILGLTDLEIPGEDSRNKQRRENQQLLQSPPTQMPGMVDPATGIEGPPQIHSTVPVGKFDRHDIELGEGVRYVNSPEGQEAKQTNPAGYANVEAHLGEHQAAIAAQQQGNQPKPPSESINFKDLPPEGQVQMAAQSQIKLDMGALVQKQAQDKADKANELKMKLGSKANGGKKA